MLYRKIIAVCSQIHTKHISTLFGQKVEFMNFWVYRDVPGFDGRLHVRHQTSLSVCDVSFSGIILSLFLFCKYKDLKIEIQHMCSVQAEVVPVVTGATGTISRSLRRYLSNIPGKHGIKELPKTAILGTAHRLREVLM
jgi:hypothetical protein